MNDFFWQSEFESNFTHFILEKLPQRLDEPEPHTFGETADIVMTFDECGRVARDRDTLNHVGIKRSLGEESVPPR